MSLHHFILTRFNILLWRRDKSGAPVRSREWLEHRFGVFERFCLPSLVGQTCKDFVWIVLFDSKTPDVFKERIEKYKEMCPQLVPVFVEPEKGRCFAEIFRNEVAGRLAADRVLTTYLDNDDSLHLRFVEDVQRRAQGLNDGTFINYNHGYQFYSDHSYVMRIHYPTNHFQSVPVPLPAPLCKDLPCAYEAFPLWQEMVMLSIWDSICFVTRTGKCLNR